MAPVRSKRLVVRAAGVVVAASAVVGVAARDAEPDGPTGGLSGPSGAAVCATCHERAHRAWAPSLHAITTTALRPIDVGITNGGSLRVEHFPGVSTWSAKGEGGGVLVETTNVDGNQTTLPAPFVVGVRRLQMFVGTMPSGALQVLPAMREATTGAWFDYTHLIFGVPDAAGNPIAPGVPGAIAAPKIPPGHPSFWTGPVRSFDARCTRCHMSGRESIAPAADGTGPRSKWRALGVDCEACHGPSEAHVALWTHPPSAPRKDPIVRWKTLDRSASLSACLTCHLEGEPVARGMAPGRDVFDFVDPTLIDDPERVDVAGRPLELIYEGLSFLSSRCAERGELTCLDCHAAHGSTNVAALVRSPTDDGLCARCHRSEAGDVVRHSHHRPDGPGGRCTACHMPPVVVERGHGVVTDHTIGVPHVAPDGDDANARDACSGCHTAGRGFPTGAPTLPAARLREASASWWPSAAAARPAWSAAFAAARKAKGPDSEAISAAIARLSDLLYDTSLPRVVRASAAGAIGRLGASGDAATRSLLDAATDDDALVRAAAIGALADVRSAEADATLLAALKDFSPLVRATAARTAIAGYARVQANSALLVATIPVLIEQTLADPDDDQRWFHLAAAREMSGDVAGAIEAYGRQTALDPFATIVRKHLDELRAKLAAKPAK